MSGIFNVDNISDRNIYGDQVGEKKDDSKSLLSSIIYDNGFDIISEQISGSETLSEIVNDDRSSTYTSFQTS